MADIQLTVDAELLKGLFEKSDGVAKLLEQVLNEVLEAQVTEARSATSVPTSAAATATATGRGVCTRASAA